MYSPNKSCFEETHFLMLESKTHLHFNCLLSEDGIYYLNELLFLLAAKIRRLYDIANVLSSLELIKKVHVTEDRGRKPAFKWTGPEDLPSPKGK